MGRSIAFGAVMTVSSLALVLSFGPQAYGDEVLDDFESYAEGSTIATGPGSEPWMKFGLATGEVSVIGGGINGTQSARFEADWSAGGFAVAEMNLATSPMNFSGFRGVTVTVMSDQSSPTSQLRAALIGAGGNSNDGYQIKDAGMMALSNTATAYEFSFDPSEWELSDDGGDGVQVTFTEALANARGIGLVVSNSGSFTEVITFDDLAVTPEPVSAVMLGVGMMLIGSGRRRMRLA